MRSVCTNRDQSIWTPQGLPLRWRDSIRPRASTSRRSCCMSETWRFGSTCWGPSILGRMVYGDAMSPSREQWDETKRCTRSKRVALCHHEISLLGMAPVCVVRSATLLAASALSQRASAPNCRTPRMRTGSAR